MKFIEKIEREYRDYKARMLQEEPEHIWDRCCEIYFYSSFYEYFLYNEAISYTTAMKLGDCENIIAGCWDLYLKNEDLSILSWEEIDLILKLYIQKEGARKDGY